MNDSPFDLNALARRFLPDDRSACAVAVSGGPDSMALCHVLSGGTGADIHAITVDHGLRPEAAAEASYVRETAEAWPCVRHITLKRNLEKLPRSKIQEAARADRYRLIADYCEAHDIGALFIAHHRDDQAETFLFRLAKGSGLDGLGAMRPVQSYNAQLEIFRPFLDVPKTALVSYCRAHQIAFIDDPSNDDDRFARVRLRQSAEVLAQEGLTAKRLSVTAHRLARARAALDEYRDRLYDAARRPAAGSALCFDYAMLAAAPAETRLRVILRAMADVSEASGYGPRMERAEDLAERLFDASPPRRTTLGGCRFTVDTKSAMLAIEKEGG